MPRGDLTALALPGEACLSDLRRIPHVIDDPGTDADLQLVHGWLKLQPLHELLTGAVNDAIEYVLDGARTWRFDLNSPEVDSDERRTVGTKLQYRVLAALGLEKEKPLDTTILGVAVELKGTIGSTWMIPREGQCEICLLMQVDAVRDRHRAFLMRVHRRWLHGGGGNQDSKRGIQAAALANFALPVIDWTDLPKNPLKLLTDEQRAVVFAPRVGQARRLTALFGYLPGIVMPRSSILTVCANKQDPLRRARQIRQHVLDEHGLRLLCGKWPAERAEAKERGFDLADAAWVALNP